jgi:poly(A) polymerase
VTRATPDQAARFVVRLLKERGHAALYAGGCVRDRLLARPAHDIDVATSAIPREVCGIFHRTIRVGEQFGIVVVRYKGQQTEVATFRSDGEYVDGRHPREVIYTTDPAQDARRRDFTVNGLFFDPIEERLYDFVGGTDDLRRKLIRAIGEPGDRFDEDKLRILRAPRFAAQLGFEIEERTAEEARRRASQIATASVSQERIRAELEKILACPGRARGVALCSELEILPVVLPEALADVPRTLRALAALPERAEPCLAWATLLHLGGPEAADQALARLRASNKEREGAVDLLARLEVARTLSGRGVAEQKRTLREAHYEELAELLRVTSLAGDGDLESYRYLRARREAFARDPGPGGLSAKPLIGGKDLKAAGLLPGKLYGQILAAVEDAQLEGRVSSREEALALALELAAEAEG